MLKQEHPEMFFMVIFAIVLFLFYKTISMLFIPLFLGAVFALVLYPLFTKINHKIKSKNICSILVVILFLLILVIPSLFAIGAIANETYKSYEKVSVYFENNNFCDINGKICSDIKKYGVDLDIKNMIKNVSNYVFEKGTAFAKNIARTGFAIFILIFSMFFFLRDGKELVLYLESLVPMEKKDKHKIFLKFKEVCQATIYGNIIVALIQGIIGGIGFAIFGISNPFLWGIVMAILALLPFGGTAIVWIPAGVIMLSMGNMFAGIGILLWGGLIVGLIDNLLKPKLIGERANLHPLLVFVSVIGGLWAFGFVGVLLGPILASLVVVLLEMYKVRFVD